MRYKAFAYRQNEKAPVQVCLIAPSCDLAQWAKVPVRLSGRPQGFQRAQNDQHVKEIKAFFSRDESKQNSSPTAILIGIDPNARDAVRLLVGADENIDGTEAERLLDTEAIGREPISCELVLDFNPWNSGDYDSKTDEIVDLFQIVRDSLATAVTEDDQDQKETELDTELGGEDDTIVSSTTDEVTEDRDSSDEEDEDAYSESDGTEIETVVPDDDFFHNLTASSLFRICENQEYAIWPIEKQQKIVDLLKDELKPGLIIDGQHRVSATKDLGPIPFLVSLLPDASWAELAFQFIINNSSAKKVDDNLLFAIVGQSLDEAQLATIERRLLSSGIKVSLIQASMRVQLEANPFQSMLNTKTPGDPGFLDATAMLKKVITLWYGTRSKSGDNPALKKVRAITGDGPEASKEFLMADLFFGNCPGETKLDKAEAWQEEIWFKYFAAFWTAVQKKYEPDGLWPRTRDHWPTTGKQGPDEERVRSLMGATILGMLQMCVLQRWAERRYDRLTGSESLADQKITPQDFENEISEVLKPLSSDFFMSFRRSGPDASNEVRQAFKTQLMLVLKEVRTVAEVKKKSDYFKA